MFEKCYNEYVNLKLANPIYCGFNIDKPLQIVVILIIPNYAGATQFFRLNLSIMLGLKCIAPGGLSSNRYPFESAGVIGLFNGKYLI
jgi:hypothetical protein